MIAYQIIGMKGFLKIILIDGGGHACKLNDFSFCGNLAKAHNFYGTYYCIILEFCVYIIVECILNSHYTYM